MKRLNELFEITYGNKLDFNKLTPRSLKKGGINFVGRSSQNHGVAGTVALIDGVKPFDEGLITVALGGSKLLSSFVQEKPFYTAQNVAVLKPLAKMTFSQMLFYCVAIRHNRFRYSAFGREANRTLRTLLVPDITEIPVWVNNYSKDDSTKYRKPIKRIKVDKIDIENWGYFELQQLFDIKKGQRLTKADMIPGNTPYIGASDSKNGVTAYVGQEPIHKGGTISVSYNGSVAEAFFQPVDFWATDDVNVLYPKGFTLTAATALFICTIIRMEKYRFSYGRKWHLDRMKETKILLPVKENGKPDFNKMENLIKSLNYSSQLLGIKSPSPSMAQAT